MIVLIQSYYAMFHAAKAVLFSMGLREKKHFAVTMVLEMLSKEGKIENNSSTNLPGRSMRGNRQITTTNMIRPLQIMHFLQLGILSSG